MSRARTRRKARPRTFRDSLGAEWTIVETTPAAEPRLLARDGAPLYGLADFEAREVVVNVEMPAASLAQTRLHELLHVALHRNSHLTTKQEEKLLGILEQHLLPILTQFGLDLGWKP